MCILAAAAALTPVSVSAHVKWFCSIADVSMPPIALSKVLTPIYVSVFCSFLLLVFAGFVLDGAVAQRWPRLASSGRLHVETEEKLLRLAVGAFFLLLWDKGAVVLWERGNAILTPELMASVGWMGVLQFAIALSVAWRRTCILGAVGIGILYGFGIDQFGIFHMTDYVFFLGIVAYLAQTSIGTQNSLRMRVPLLSGSLAFSLMWTAIEKFVYPEWTLFVVAEHPDLAFGFPWGFVVVVAGFVEFTLAFYLMTGRGLVRFGAAAYASIFIAAIPEFGHLDAVGHIPIIGILAVVCLRGASPLPRLLGLIQRRPIVNAAGVAGFYVASLVVLFAMYYGLQWSEYG
ncbi:hypothetical protein [Rhodopila sp.]|uniref:hypothetical protein n=1 Tax=Rhodopila sp. TaxID=2480087 RepID=UPI003D0F5748